MYNILNNEDNFSELSNNEILFGVKQLEADYEALKTKIIRDFDKLVEIEKRFQKANRILLERLKK